jgi:hypothetical protein
MSGNKGLTDPPFYSTEPVDTGCPADVLESTPEFQGCRCFTALSVTVVSVLRGIGFQ